MQQAAIDCADETSAAGVIGVLAEEFDPAGDVEGMEGFVDATKS